MQARERWLRVIAITVSLSFMFAHAQESTSPPSTVPKVKEIHWPTPDVSNTASAPDPSDNARTTTRIVNVPLNPAEKPEWPDETTIKPGSTILVVTLAKPKSSQKCHVESLDAGHITCSRFGTFRTFDRAQIEALIRPGYRPRKWLWNSICGAFAGGSIYGAVILTGISVFAAVPGIAMAVIVTFDALVLAGDANAIYGPDDLLYLKSGEPLTVSLAVEP